LLVVNDFIFLLIFRGYNFELKLVDGSEVNIKSQPHGKIVVPGIGTSQLLSFFVPVSIYIADSVFMLKGKGMPKNKYKQTFGNLFVSFKIEYPSRPFLPKDFILV
jgi:hypothetical protein